jgi:hypothetical protein
MASKLVIITIKCTEEERVKFQQYCKKHGYVQTNIFKIAVNEKLKDKMFST